MMMLISHYFVNNNNYIYLHRNLKDYKLFLYEYKF